MTDQKDPYYSTRTRLGTVLSPKEHAGKKEITVEVTYGNMENIIVKDEKDIANILDNIPLSKKLWDLHEQVKKDGVQLGYEFV